MKNYYKPTSGLGLIAAQTYIQPLFQQAIQLHQQGHLTQAQIAYDRILSLQPKHAQALHLKGVLATQTGQLPRAVELFEQAIQADPVHPAFYCNRGNALLQMGRAEAAIGSYDKAISLAPNYADAYANRGAALAALGRLSEAVASYHKAIELNPTHGTACYNCATALHALGQFDTAISQFDRAIALKGDWYEAHCGKGKALKELGRLDEAITSYNRCLEINPQLADAHFCKGSALQLSDKVDQAINAYAQAVALKPDFTEAHGNLGDCLYKESKYLEALGHYIRSIFLNESVAAKAGFARCVRHIRFLEATPEVKRLVARAIAEAWIRPAMLFATAISLVKIDPDVKDCMDRAASAWPIRLDQEALFGVAGAAKLANDELLQCLLRHMAVTSIEVEHFITASRSVLLSTALDFEFARTELAEDSGNEHGDLLNFFAALACQCFVNDYAFANSDTERVGIAKLQSRLLDRVATGLAVPDIWLVALAAYLPLNSLSGAENFAQTCGHESVRSLLAMQVTEPAVERNYRRQIPMLTEVDDSVSDLVQNQYESNPYPRWIKTSFTIKPYAVDNHLRSLFPKCTFDVPADVANPEVLIAGCGTGQQSIEAAQKFLNATVLAIDLSGSSLAYAMRKTAECGLQNVQYGQADILNLGQINRSFDVIESVGVLHHLANPMAGWKVLTDMLRPGGFMRLGFYSELARRDIVKAQRFVVEGGYQATAEDIRRCRQDLMSAENKEKFGNLFTMRDFFGISECRDLLFHVQEHRYTIPQLKSDLEELDLSFLGFFFENDTHRKYAARFPEDLAMTNLDNWHVFEIEHPDTFISMYQFWTQKKFAPPANTFPAI
jgi:tetratricopeptide (TPR) repeat protein/2-polyprenyl-3-methyl-5-hydroxy-6-metoxy-1,4-benzoquinol methylase